MTRQDPEILIEGRNGKHTYDSEVDTAKIDWPCHQNAIENFRCESDPNANRRNPKRNKTLNGIKSTYNQKALCSGFQQTISPGNKLHMIEESDNAGQITAKL